MRVRTLLVICTVALAHAAAYIVHQRPDWGSDVAWTDQGGYQRLGEVPVAFVTLKPGQTLDEAALIAYARDNMAHFKAPKKIVFGDLPKNATGKIQKFVLRDTARGLRG